VVAWIFVLAVPVVPLIAWGRPWYPPDAILKSKLSLLWILLFPTILAYFLNSWVLSRVSASVTAVYIYLQPVLSSVAAVIILRESFGQRELLCAVLVFAGIQLVSRSPTETSHVSQVH
jgi:drug/metabolite transporter (DMT)-like permease